MGPSFLFWIKITRDDTQAYMLQTLKMIWSFKTLYTRETEVGRRTVERGFWGPEQDWGEQAVHKKWLAELLQETYRIPAQQQELQGETSGYKLCACRFRVSSFRKQTTKLITFPFIIRDAGIVTNVSMPVQKRLTGHVHSVFKRNLISLKCSGYIIKMRMRISSIS